MKKIPVIGTAVMKNPHWVKRLYESIDYPLENFVIFNNNGEGEITEDLEKLRLIENKFIDKLVICHLPSNLGVSAAWNLIIKSYINSPYWIIVNDDVAFTEGLLEEIVACSENEEVGMVHPYAGDFGEGAWDLFLIKDFIIQEFGLFDENFTPAYCEDVDYIMRLHNSKIKKICGLSRPYLHGTGLNTEYNTHGSQTKKTNTELEKRLNEINLINFGYLNEKWGEGWRYISPKSLPFDIYPINYTTFDLNFIRSKNIKKNKIMKRTEIIQKFIHQTKAKKYLEIGMGDGINFSDIECEYKVCVDPNPIVPVTYQLSSDDFFLQNKEKFDIIFVDGFHWSDQVYKDIINSLEVLNDEGVIICHDMNPSSESIQEYPQPENQFEWTGDCWKAWVKLKSEREDLEMFVIDTDFGCGIIKKGSQKIINPEEELSWSFFEKNRKLLLNLISVNSFIEYFKN